MLSYATRSSYQLTCRSLTLSEGMVQGQTSLGISIAQRWLASSSPAQAAASDEPPGSPKSDDESQLPDTTCLPDEENVESALTSEEVAWIKCQQQNKTTLVDDVQKMRRVQYKLNVWANIATFVQKKHTDTSRQSMKISGRGQQIKVRRGLIGADKPMVSTRAELDGALASRVDMVRDSKGEIKRMLRDLKKLFEEDHQLRHA